MRLLDIEKVVTIAKSVSDAEYLKAEYPDEVWWSYEWDKAMSAQEQTRTLPKKLTLADISD